MKVKYNLKTWIYIDLLIIILTLLILLAIALTPDINVNELDEISRAKYEWKILETKIPVWKIISGCAVAILCIMHFIIYYTKFRCKHCKKHIRFINLKMKYCPYCSKELY